MDGAPARKPCCVCAAPGGKHCTKCKSRHYCSKKCQLVDWHEGGHKAQCRQMTAAFQDRMLDAIMPEKKPKEEPLIVADVAPAAGSKARLPAVPTEPVMTSAPNDDTPDWRGTCAICLDLLPIKGNQQIFYACCCKCICTGCADKCRQYDTRCPLCRAPGPTSAAECLRWVQKHVDEENAEAQMQLGDSYSYGALGLTKCLKRAGQLYELAAAQGHAGGQYALGCCYDSGNGVKIDHKTAAHWYRRAAEQGHPNAQNSLGKMCSHGEGVAQSYEEAAQWWRLAAAQGLPDALYCLGASHIFGNGVPQDPDEALRLHKRAAAKGHAGAAASVEPLEEWLAALSAPPP